VSITISGRAVKRPAKMAMVNTNVSASALAVRAWRRAKAPAPWANLTYSPTECGLAAMDGALAHMSEDELLEESALADDTAWVLEHYRVAPDGDRLRFEGYAPGDFARVSVPVPGEATLVWRSSLACLPDAAFAVAAAEWVRAQARKGGAR